MKRLDLGYYPGCSLGATAREYDASTRSVLSGLGVELHDLPDWSCCGARSAERVSDDLAVALPERNIRIAIQEGRDVLVPCAACYNRLKTANVYRENEDCVAILSILELLSRPELRDRLARRITTTLRGLPVVPYYGCLLTRPRETTGAASAFNPTNMGEVLFTLGADVRRWSEKTTCCGASLTLAEPDIVERLCDRLRDTAVEAGARAFVTVCPMCQNNLDTRQLSSPKLPTFFLTELLALALGIPETDRYWKDHWIDPRPLLNGYGMAPS